MLAASAAVRPPAGRSAAIGLYGLPAPLCASIAYPLLLCAALPVPGEHAAAVLLHFAPPAMEYVWIHLAGSRQSAIEASSSSRRITTSLKCLVKLLRDWLMTPSSVR